MDQSVKQVIEQCASDSYAGKISFGAVVGALMHTGGRRRISGSNRPVATDFRAGDYARKMSMWGCSRAIHDGQHCSAPESLVLVYSISQHFETVRSRR